MTHAEFFAWMKLQQKDGRLTQDMVDGANELLEHVTTEQLRDSLIKVNDWREFLTPSILLTPNPNPPKSTKADIIAAANRINVEPAALKALSDVESRGGFNGDGTPKILFERHKYWQALTAINWFTKRNEIAAKYPDICSQSTGAYNARPQYEKLRIAATLNWDAAHESASWGAFQIMGYHWKALGYESIRDFVTRMYVSEAEHLEAVCRFIKSNGLDKALRNKDWAAFARGYNGIGYRKNDYDNKIAKAYRVAKSSGW